jgi:hypothetical protein
VRTALLRQPELADAAVVVAAPAGERSLYGFYVCRFPLDAGALRRRLAEVLPAYMVPARLEELSVLPVNDNGKVDRTALAARAGRTGAAAGAASAVPPAEGPEGVVREAWEEVLGRDTAVAGADFFDLGGDSLLAARLVALVDEEVPGLLHVRDVFADRTLEALLLRAARS